MVFQIIWVCVIYYYNYTIAIKIVSNNLNGYILNEWNHFQVQLLADIMWLCVNIRLTENGMNSMIICEYCIRIQFTIKWLLLILYTPSPSLSLSLHSVSDALSDHHLVSPSAYILFYERS